MKNFKAIIILLIAVFLIPFFAYADSLGETRVFNVDRQYDAFSRSQVSATLRVLSEHGYFYVADDYWNSLSFAGQNNFSSQAQQLAGDFENSIYPIETSAWGQEPLPGIDNDPRTVVLLTNLIDQAGGYFDGENSLRKTASRPDSNERDMVYVNAKSLATGRAKSFLAHEFQHLIALNQKFFRNQIEDDVWLNELRAEYSVTLSGFDADYPNSNLSRRANNFLAAPSEPLGEWKNLNSDYNIVNLLGQYIVDRYGLKVLVDSLRSSSVNIPSLNQALLANGHSDDFQKLFLNWAAAVFVNNESAGTKYSYANPNLKNLRVSPTQTIAGISGSVTISGQLKDWQPAWYELNSINGNIKADFSVPESSAFRVDYILFKENNVIEVKEMNIQNGKGTLYIPKSPAVWKVVFIPVSMSKLGDFSVSEPSTNFALNFSLVSEVPSDAAVKDGDLIRPSNVSDIYVVMGKWRRFFTSSKIIDLYGHLSLSKVITVNVDLANKYQVTNLVRPINSPKVYAIWPDGTKHWLNITAKQFTDSGRQWDSIFIVSEAEINFYKEGVRITR